jgi:tRNA threonylcarbamoyladenosine biosynthesis protein TsaE
MQHTRANSFIWTAHIGTREVFVPLVPCLHYRVITDLLQILSVLSLQCHPFWSRLDKASKRLKTQWHESWQLLQKTEEKMKIIDLHTEQDTKDLAAYIAPLLKPGDVISLAGDLGSGKTFFAKQIGLNLGIDEEIDSPTFVILKEYHCGIYPMYHLDLYRLKNENELMDLGIFDMLESGITLIEWPELAEQLLPYQTLKLVFHFDGKQRFVELYPDEEHKKYF